MADAKRGKVVDIGALIGEGRAKVGRGEPPPDDPADAPHAQDQLPASQEPPDRPEPEGPVTSPPPPGRSAPPAAAASQDPTPPGPSARPEPGQAVTRLEPLYTRVPEHLKARLDDASHALRGMKASNQEIVAALLAQEVDPSTPAGLAALTKRLERYRRANLGR
jgi:hypothetical protein